MKFSYVKQCINENIERLDLIFFDIYCANPICREKLARIFNDRYIYLSRSDNSPLIDFINNTVAVQCFCGTVRVITLVDERQGKRIEAVERKK